MRTDAKRKVFLTKADDILKFAKTAIDSDDRSKLPRNADGSVPLQEIDVPFRSPMDRTLNSMSVNSLDVPLNQQGEVYGQKWLKDKDSWTRRDGVAVLGHIRADENIAMLKAFTASSPQRQKQDPGQAQVEQVARAEAMTDLRAWGIDAGDPRAATQPGDPP